VEAADPIQKGNLASARAITVQPQSTFESEVPGPCATLNANRVIPKQWRLSTFITTTFLWHVSLHGHVTAGIDRITPTSKQSLRHKMGAPEDHSPANHHDANDSQHGNEGDKSFIQKGRPARFIVVGLLRLLGTAILAVLFYLLIRFYQDRTLASGQKTIFDALVVAISLALGLNSAASLRHIAIHAKRWFDGRRNTRVTEVRRSRTRSGKEPVGAKISALTFRLPRLKCTALSRWFSCCCGHRSPF
jgi:hypothetical protein